MDEKKKYILWVDDGEGWYIFDRYSTEGEAFSASEQFDYDGCYSYVEEE